MEYWSSLFLQFVIREKMKSLIGTAAAAATARCQVVVTRTIDQTRPRVTCGYQIKNLQLQTSITPVNSSF